MNFRNLLYDHPELYEKIYPEPDLETSHMCERLVQNYYGSTPTSILDVGCGIGRDLNGLAQLLGIKNCRGFDLLPAMIEFAKKQYPGILFEIGDMRSYRIPMTFDIVTCMGSVLMYALTTEDIRQTFETFAAHCHPGSLLILDINNSISYLNLDGFKKTVDRTIQMPDFQARFIAEHSFNLRKQLMIRKRVWTFPDKPHVEDYCEYRMFFPEELHFILELNGFELLDMFDNMVLGDSDLSAPRLYIAAKYVGK